jgi:hypothetical protein
MQEETKSWRFLSEDREREEREDWLDLGMMESVEGRHRSRLMIPYTR